jgi:hypothetical protein
MACLTGSRLSNVPPIRSDQNVAHAASSTLGEIRGLVEALNSHQDSLKVDILDLEQRVNRTISPLSKSLANISASLSAFTAKCEKDIDRLSRLNINTSDGVASLTKHVLELDDLCHASFPSPQAASKALGLSKGLIYDAAKALADSDARSKNLLIHGLTPSPDGPV